MTSVKVAVRVRPFNKQEKDEKATNCITMEGPMIHIRNLVSQANHSGRKERKQLHIRSLLLVLRWLHLR